MVHIGIPRYGAVRSQNDAGGAHFIQNLFRFLFDFFPAAPVNHILFRLSEAADDCFSMEELFPFLQGNPFYLHRPVHCLEGIILVPFQVIVETVVPADVKDIAALCCIGCLQNADFIGSHIFLYASSVSLS